MTLPNTIRLTKTDTSLGVVYRPRSDSWRYLLLFFSSFCLLPVLFEAWASNSLLLYLIVGAGVLLSAYIIIEKEIYALTIKTTGTTEDPYRNSATPPVLYANRKKIIPPSGEALLSFELEEFQETDADGALTPRYKLIALYTNKQPQMLIPRINRIEEATALQDALQRALQPKTR
jgi:hypothetical protein